MICFSPRLRWTTKCIFCRKGKKLCVYISSNIVCTGGGGGGGRTGECISDRGGLSIPVHSNISLSLSPVYIIQ